MKDKSAWLERTLGSAKNTLRPYGGLVRLSLPGFSYEINVDDFLDRKTTDERIARLGAVHRDLAAAAAAVDELRSEAEKRQAEADTLRQAVSQLREEAGAAQAILSLSEEALARLLAKAGSKGRARGLLEGTLIGLATGFISSLLAGYLSK